MDPAANGPHFHRQFARELVLDGQVKRVNRVRAETRVEGRGGRPLSLPLDAGKIRLWKCRGWGDASQRGRGAVTVRARTNAKGGIDVRSHAWIARRHLVARLCCVV